MGLFVGADMSVAISIALDGAAAAERAKIVAWLRDQAESEGGWIPDLVRVSDAIERGEHDNG